MKKPSIFLLALILSNHLMAQQKDFEGIVVYKVDVKSRYEGISEKALKNILGYGDTLTVEIKKGNYKRSSALSDEYYIPSKGRAYVKFKNIDTLFYVDYSSDTSTVISLNKSEEKKTIAGFECKALSIETKDGTTKYFYAPALYMNPEYNAYNKIGHFDLFSKEAASIWLSSYSETKNYSLFQNCIKLVQTSVDDVTFMLPKLPEKKFAIESIIVPAKFFGSGGWVNYLKTSINSKLGAKYINIPKKEEMASQTVIVGFVINEKGEVTKARVLNEKEVHPKLAEEALRVINESSGWKPANVFGEKIPFWLNQPITFEAWKK